MPTKKEIEAKYKKLHNKLTKAYYGGTSGLTKAEFDQLHGKIWSDMDTELIAEGYLTPPVPVRNLAAEIDQVISRLNDLELK